MKETGHLLEEIPTEDARSRYYMRHPYAGMPLLRRVIAYRESVGLEAIPKDRKLAEIKKVA